jgi:ribosomal protein S27AE
LQLKLASPDQQDRWHCNQCGASFVADWRGRVSRL